jgi:molybdate transport system regulatory protein
VNLYPRSGSFDPTSLGARNRLDGTVQSVETDGLIAEIELDADQVVTAVVTTGSVERLGVEEGTELGAVVEATAVMVETED